MSLIRRNPKRDSTEKECRSYLQSRGAVVIPLSGPGLPDLLVGWRGKWVLVECKAAGGHLTERQEEFFALCDVKRLPARIVFGMDDCKNLLHALLKAP